MVEEVVIIDARRTPIGKYHGSLKKFSAVALGTAVAKDMFERNQKIKEEIAQVIIGNVLKQVMAKTLPDKWPYKVVSQWTSRHQRSMKFVVLD